MNNITHSYSKDIEKEFKKDFFEKSIKTIRYSFLILAFMYSMFAYLDVLLAGSLLKQFLYIRFLVVVPLLLTTFLLSFGKYFRFFWQELLLFTNIIGGAGIVIMIVQLPAESFYSNGLMLIFLAGSIFIKLRSFYSTLAAIVNIILYNILAIYYFNNNIDTVVLNDFFFVSAIFISAFASYYTEVSDRENFDLLRQLGQKNSEIQEINSSLELTVEKRTSSLYIRNEELKEEISQRKIVEIELEAAKEKAEHADKLKSAFLANMSHEIRTPMNGIIGFANLLHEAENEEELDEFIKIIVNSGEHLLNLIDEIMDLSKIEAGIIKVKVDHFSLNELTKDIYDMFVMNKNVIDKDIALSYENGLEDNESFISTDRMRLKQILVNLVNNACKYTEVGSVKFCYKSINSQLEFTIEDTGIGISDEQQELIFDRFMQVSMSNNKVHGSAGLGLSITKIYLKMIGGNIKVNSKLGKGSKFIFNIPIKYDKQNSIS
ncbi:MAG: hypothetical protein KAG84_02505 [Bacteroidales bacterium]|nr:hypothetical protein [Bacteroidales bacterium]